MKFKEKMEILLLIILISGIVIIPGFLASRNQALFFECRDNIAKIGMALEMYWDKEKSYPPSLSFLVPNYLEKIPHCQASQTLWKGIFGINDGVDTYSKGYTVNKSKFTIYCTLKPPVFDYPKFPDHSTLKYTSDDFHPKFFWIKRIMQKYQTIDFVSLLLRDVVRVYLKTRLPSNEAEKLAEEISKSYSDTFKESWEVWIIYKEEILASKS